MHISEVRVTNFRTLKSNVVETSEYNPIVGYNNCGKSNFLRAVHWLLKKSALPEACFHDPATEVCVEGVVDGVAAAIHLLPANQQAQIAPYIIGNRLTFRRRQEAPGTSATLVKLEVLDSTGNWRPNPTGIDNALGILLPEPVYIKAMDDAGDDVGKYAAKNTIGLLIKYAIEKARASNAASMQSVDSALEDLRINLNGPSRLPELSELANDATQSIQSFFSGISIEIEIPPPSIDEIIKSASVKLIEGQSKERSFSEYGHGTQRTVQMALIKLLAHHAAHGATGGPNTVILIDEPELYLHPQAIGAVRTALKRLATSGFQILFSTHSPMMIDAEDAPDTIGFWKCPSNGTQARLRVRSALTGLSSNQNKVDVLYSLKHSAQWLFSDNPVVVEGKTERMLLPSIYRAVNGVSLAERSVSLIESTGSSSSLEIADLLKSLGYSAKIIVDLDFAFKIGVPTGLFPSADPNIVACLQWLTTNSGTIGFSLDAAGLPTKGGALKPEKAYEELAAALPAECQNIHAHLLSYGIWLWPKGAIEAHLGISKSNADRSHFSETTILTKSISHAADPGLLCALAAWI